MGAGSSRQAQDSVASRHLRSIERTDTEHTVELHPGIVPTHEISFGDLRTARIDFVDAGSKREAHKRVAGPKALHRAHDLTDHRWIRPVFPHHPSDPPRNVQRILHRARTGRRGAWAVIQKKQVIRSEQLRVMLTLKASKRIVHDRELIVASDAIGEPPIDVRFMGRTS